MLAQLVLAELLVITSILDDEGMIVCYGFGTHERPDALIRCLFKGITDGAEQFIHGMKIDFRQTGYTRENYVPKVIIYP